MPYKPVTPNKLGLTQLIDINLREIVPLIQWSFFFRAWRLTGKYDGIETVCSCTSCQVGWLQKFSDNEREKAQEALKLYRDAQEMLRQFLDEKSIQINASFCLHSAHSLNDDIVIQTEFKDIIIPTLRQQHASTDGYCYSLADFLAEKDDFIGFFSSTVVGAEAISMAYEQENDVYRSILVKTLADRVAEATTEWLHYQVRKKYWGYAPDEELNVANILKNDYQGIRPAVGYPSLPDQSIIFDIEKLLEFHKIGITLTENGAMYPNASVCGLYFAHPQSKYFMIGKISQEQLDDYAMRRGKPTDQMRKWLISNI